MGSALNKTGRIKFSVVSLFFTLGILVLSFGFLLSNCGKGEKTKVVVHDKGQFAIHLPMDQCDGDGTCSVTTTDLCGKDEDCPAGETCVEGTNGAVGQTSVVLNAEKMKERIKGEGSCSVTTSTVCRRDLDCPAGETCNLIPGSTDFTIEGWVKTAPSAANNSGKGVLFSFGSSDGGGGFALWLWQQTAGRTAVAPEQCPPGAPNGRCVKFLVHDIGPDTATVTCDSKSEEILVKNSGDGGSAIAVASNDIVDGQWHHVAAVLNGTTMTVYIDGVPGNNAGGDYPNPNTNGVRLVNFIEENFNRTCDLDTKLAANIGSNLSNFQGGSGIRTWELGAASQHAEPNGDAATYIFSNGDFTVDEVRVWTTARTQAQIQACMNRELNTYGSAECTINSDVMGYWKFNKGMTSIDGGAEDASSNDFSGNGVSGSNTQCQYPGDTAIIGSNLEASRCTDSAGYDDCGGCGQGFKDKNGDGNITDVDPKETMLNDIPYCAGGWVDGVPGLARADN